jgi:adenine-specific DNA-methyltransferase
MGATDGKNDTLDGAAANADPMPRNENKGRLELTWANKDRALLSREDGSYEWVPKRDHRVAEVRLLRDAGTVGDVHADDERAKDNLLIRGDALNGLTALAKSPEFAEEYAGKVKLAYIDPPFNTGQAFEHYDDGLEHSVWLTMMRDRLMQIKELLAPDGSIWVHLDDAEMAYCRVLMDEVFGRENFIATLLWQKVHGSKNTAAHFSTDQDYVLVFARDATLLRTNRLARTAAMDARYSNPDDDPRGPWTSGDLAARNHYSEGTYPIECPSGRIIEGPPPGSYWRYSQSKLRDLDKDGRIWWGETGGNVPRIKRFLSEVQEGRVAQTWLPHTEVGHTQEAKKEIKALVRGRTPFDTPKPERLMERIVHIGSNPGDIVLDCFAGSGTTAAVAHKMGRRWVTMELSESTIDTFTAPRLEKVVKGDDSGGITESVKWQGGGGFRVLDVAPSIFEDDEGVVVLADWVTDHDLGQAVAAQLGFEYEPEQPFCGRQGKLRLAVIDGHVDKAAVQLLVQSLEKGEKLSLCATSLDPAAAEALKKISRGSQARVVPQDILLSYRTPSNWQASVASGGGGE